MIGKHLFSKIQNLLSEAGRYLADAGTYSRNWIVQCYQENITNIWKSLGWIAGAGIFCLVIVFMHRSIYAYLLQEPRYHVNVDQPDAVQLPSWVTGDVKKQIFRNHSRKTISTIDPESLHYIRWKYEQSPWVRKVLAVRKQYPDEITVEYELRKPVTAFRGPDRFWYLADRTGTRVPGKYGQIPDEFGTIYRVKGFQSAPPDVGEKWDESRVQTISRLVEKMYHFGLHEKINVRALQLVGGDQQWRKGLGKVILKTEQNVWVHWGRPPGRTSPTEPNFRRKIENLDRVLEVSPKLKGIGEVKLQFEHPVISKR